MEELETVRNLEAQLVEKRKQVVGLLRTRRESLGLSLRAAGKKVRLTQAALHNIETGKSWKTPTVLRIARTYEKLAA